jgi:hypothetical protein
LCQCCFAIVPTAKLIDVKEQQICIKFCFKLSKMASETHRMLEEAFGDNSLGQMRMYEYLKHSKKFATDGILHKEFVPSSQTVNGKFSCNALREKIQHKYPDKWHNNSWALHHDNALAHTSLIVQQFLASTKTTFIPHPSYSLDLAPCEFFFLFPKMKLKLKRRRSDSTEEIQTKVTKTLMRNDFQQCFRSWKSCWDHCINAEGDYLKGDGGK